MRDQLEKMLEAGHDGPLLRFSLGELLYKEAAYAPAVEHLGEAVRLDPAYSAAWKLYGQSLIAAGRVAAGIDALERGIEVASERGDHQAAKEMRVFAKRARRSHSPEA